MATHDHSETCRCSLHARLQARRHEAYRQLAFAILGPSAPRQDDRALAHALAEHAGLTPRALRRGGPGFDLPRAA